MLTWLVGARWRRGGLQRARGREGLQATAQKGEKDARRSLLSHTAQKIFRAAKRCRKSAESLRDMVKGEDTSTRL